MNIACLLVPILIGLICAILGYLLGRYCFRKNEVQPLLSDLNECKENSKKLSATISSLEEKLKAKKPEKEESKTSNASKSSAYKIEDIEGIGPVIGEKLRNVGIINTDDFLENSKTQAQRKKLADDSELTEKQILKFANMVDLLRIAGVGPEFAELLEASGVDTVPELAQRKADNLAKKMDEVNAEKKLCRRIPSVNEVSDWVEQAKKLPRALEY